MEMKKNIDIHHLNDLNHPSNYYSSNFVITFIYLFFLFLDQNVEKMMNLVKQKNQLMMILKKVKQQEMNQQIMVKVM